MQSSEDRTDPPAATTQRASGAEPSRRGGESPLIAIATTAALLPFALILGTGLAVWGISRDLQRTAAVRVPGLRRVLVWVGGDVAKERGRE